jgi:hypothetical protein
MLSMVRTLPHNLRCLHQFTKMLRAMIFVGHLGVLLMTFDVIAPAKRDSSDAT